MKKRPLAPVVALQLLGKWNRIARGHVALSAGCSCGVGVSNLQVQDFEQDILDFLRGRHGDACCESSIAALLTSIARQGEAQADGLLADLERSLASFEELHSGR